MFFTESGRAYVEKVYEIPEMGRAARGGCKPSGVCEIEKDFK